MNRNPSAAMPRCGAKKRDGSPCGQPRRKNSLRCRLHGGNSPQSLVAAERRGIMATVTAQVAKPDGPRELTAEESVLEDHARTLGAIDRLTRMAEQDPANHAYSQLLLQQQTHLAKLNDQAMRFNVKGRIYQMKEAELDLLHLAMVDTARELRLDPDVAVRVLMTNLRARLPWVEEEGDGVVDAEIVIPEDEAEWYRDRGYGVNGELPEPEDF